MRILGAILAGGQARRFGSDKAHALYQGERLIERVASALAAQCEGVVVCGRSEPGFACIADRPGPGLGPLGGLNAALHHARAGGFDAVLSAPCDVPDLPHDLAQCLSGTGAGIVAGQPVIGLWPVSAVRAIDTYLGEGGRRLFGFAERIGARLVPVDPPLMNVNRPEDLDRESRTNGAAGED